MQENSQSFEYDIRPAASILNVFSRLNYKAHYAIAEFVDNSTQSFMLHEEELMASEPNYQMSVKVEYDSDRKTLFVIDNAFGMERDRFLDAITLDAKNPEQVNSRNEFGMGLKTAASWFGNVWMVSSTALGSDKRYTATVDIPMLKETGMNNISINVTPAKPEEHGTTIVITEVTKGMGPRTIGKIRSLLSSMYRRDLESGKISITVNGQEMSFSSYPILKFRDQVWKKDIDFTIEFGGKTYRAKGFVGIMSPGSFPKAGFALFRRNRVVLGGEGQNYKPYEIFGQAQTQVSLKLFGELDMDDYPVNQAKDGFIWDDGLEDEFVRALKSNIREYIDIAKLTTKERVAEERFSDEASARVETKVEEALQKAFSEPPEASRQDDPESRRGDDFVDDIVRRFEEEQREFDSAKPDADVGGKRTYTVPISNISKRNIEVSWTIANGSRWIDVDDSGDTVSVVININHPFFKPYSNEEEFQYVLEKLVIAFVVAEMQAKVLSSENGYVPASAICRNMNDILSKLEE